MKTYYLEFELPTDPKQVGDFVDHLISRRWKVVHMDEKIVTCVKRYTRYEKTKSSN